MLWMNSNKNLNQYVINLLLIELYKLTPEKQSLKLDKDKYEIKEK